MAVRPPTFRPPAARSKREREQAADARRGSARARGYDGRWDKASATHRRRNPFCQYCEAGAFGPHCVAAAELTDHLYPHRTFAGIFWRTEWWVSCCATCHAGPKQTAEREGLAALHRLADLLALPRLTGEGGGSIAPTLS
jgi:5-methylcytosine-specific restriction protein A